MEFCREIPASRKGDEKKTLLEERLRRRGRARRGPRGETRKAAARATGGRQGKSTKGFLADQRLEV